MQKILIFIILCLAVGLVFFQQKNTSLSRDYSLKCDSLNDIKQRLLSSKMFRINSKVELFLGNSHLIFLNDKLESHRIMANYGQDFFDLRFNLKEDSSVDLMTVRYSEKHPLTGVGFDTIYSVIKQKIAYSVLKEFKNKLSKINFLEAHIDYNTLCCFGGGGIFLESKLSREKTMRFSTWCRESIEFAEACEFLMRCSNDEVLKRKLNGTN